MIRLFIDHIDEENGLVCATLVSSDGGKIASDDVNGNCRIKGITRKIPIKIVLHQGDEYFLTDSDTKFFMNKLNEFRTDVREGYNRS